MMRNRKKEWMALLCVCLLLTGCAGEAGNTAASPTLPPVTLSYDVPENDVKQEISKSVLLYLPSLDGTRLIAVPQSASLSVSRHNAETLCTLLFAHPGTDQTVPLGGDTPLKLSETEAVEVSGKVATVSLAASALRLSHEELFTVGQALANTLCQFGDLEYVNVLISGVQPGLDVASTLPAGCYQPNMREDLITLRSRASAAKTAARRAIVTPLYYPAAGGKGILSEARTLSFSDLEGENVIATLLEALSAGAESLSGLPRFPDLNNLLSEPPAIFETGGARRAILQFDESLNALLIESGITRSVMVASLVYTITTFLPALEGVEMTIGSERILSLTPSGTYTGAGETMLFPNGLMKRSDFSGFLLDACPLYFANGSGKLTLSSRAVPFYESRSVRRIIGQLMAGPQNYDSVSGLEPVLPEGLRDSDLIGVSLEKETLLLNFSSRLLTLSQGMSPETEKRMIYAVVNTLCELPGVERVCFFIMGQQPETLAGSVFLPGDFLPNPDIIQ